ncbi:MAG: DeoR/GlpR family DNA-binding transcription regulator [Roseburia sp.]|nr:DeoR/GlpR family DNA-binding transcription regulator [Roseburia sp.]MCM1099493.1 DeoR/GlpR family DNA-binding transcription regulator [Ruminococcus flavefaciens]
MLAVERRNLILEKLQDEKKVVVSELSAAFGVSEETIRRDLDRLDREGLATKSYGGAILNENNGLDMPFNVRKKRNMEGKQVIAGLVNGLVQEGEHIILDPSTTAVAIVKALKSRKRLTVITNSIEVLVELSDVSGWDVISTGGILRESYLALVGSRAVSGIESLYADKVILSCKGVDRKRGITDSNEMFSEVKQAMLRSARQKILAADHTKFGKVAFSGIGALSDVDMVVTDIRPDPEWMDYFAEKGIECLYGGD